jgi:hypothetical protein
MKMKTLSCIIITSLVSAPLFALEITKGHLISHKEWSTNDAKGNFISSHEKPKDMISQLNATEGPSSDIATSAQLYPIKGAVNKPFTTEGINYADITNNSDKTQRYQLSYETCVETTDKVVNCIFYDDVLELEAGGHLNDTHKPNLTATIKQPGSYRAESKTTVYPEHYGYGTDGTSLAVSAVTIS